MGRCAVLFTCTPHRIFRSSSWLLDHVHRKNAFVGCRQISASSRLVPFSFLSFLHSYFIFLSLRVSLYLFFSISCFLIFFLHRRFRESSFCCNSFYLFYLVFLISFFFSSFFFTLFSFISVTFCFKN